MSLPIRLKIFLFGAIVLTYVLRWPGLIDEFHAVRFVSVSLFCLFGIWSILLHLKKLDFHLLDTLLFFFFGLHLFSILWAHNVSEAVITTQRQLVLFTVYFIIRSILCHTKSSERTIQVAISAVGVFALLITSYQLIKFGLSEGLADKAIYKVIGHSGHKNALASLLFLLLGLHVFYTRSDQPSGWFWGLTGWYLLVIFLLRSRAAYLASLGLGLCLLWQYVQLKSKHHRLILKRLLPTFVIVAMAGIAFINLTAAGKDYRKYTNPATYLGSASGAERLFVWSKTAALIKDRPWQGYGAGNWKIFFPSKGIQGGYRLQQKDVVFTRAHNDFLEVAAELGLVGLLNYLLIFGLASWAIGWTQKKKKEEQQWKGMVLLGTLLGYCILSFFDFPKERIELLVMLAVLLATIAWHSLAWFEGAGFYRVLSTPQRLTGGIVLTLLLLTHMPIGMLRIENNRLCVEIYANKNQQNWPKLIELSHKANKYWHSADPSVVPFVWYEGLGHYMRGEYERSLPLFAQAYEYNPFNFHVINNYASTMVMLGQYEPSIDLFLKALEINPMFEDGMFNLSYSYYQIGRYKKALNWVNKTKNNPSKKEEFIQIISQAMQPEVK